MLTITIDEHGRAFLKDASGAETSVREFTYSPTADGSAVILRCIAEVVGTNTEGLPKDSRVEQALVRTYLIPAGLIKYGVPSSDPSDIHIPEETKKEMQDILDGTISSFPADGV